MRRFLLLHYVILLMPGYKIQTFGGLCAAQSESDSRKSFSYLEDSELAVLDQFAFNQQLALMGSLSTESATPLTEKDIERGETSVLVSPVNPTPTKKFYLSNIDVSLAFPAETLFVYPAPATEDDIVERVKKSATEELLIPYYFMAGRIDLNPESNRLELVCNNAGGLFVDATCERTLAELGDTFSAPNPAFQHLILRIHPSAPLLETPLLTIQVTRFRCGGFSVGFSTSHAILDGLSAIRMFEALAAICRGEVLKSPEFHVDRSCMKARDPAQVAFPHTEYIPLTDPFSSSEPALPAPEPKNYEYQLISISPTMINELKSKVATRCSTFDAIVAHLWRARTKATLGDAPLATSSMLFAVDIRSKVSPHLPPGFIGNAVIPMEARATVADLEAQPLSFAVRKVREAIERVSDEYVRSAIDWLEVHKTGPALGNGRFVVSAWWKLSFHGLDFGYGKPLYGGPVMGSLHDFVLLLSDGNKDGKAGGINVWMALEPTNMKKFLNVVFEI